jgi:hypothetical protein
MHLRVIRLIVFSGVLVSASCRRLDRPAVYSSRIGVAVKLADRVCMAIGNPTLLPSTTITLIAPADSAKNRLVQSARAQVLSRDAAVCPGTNGESGLSNYNLDITTGSIAPNVLMVALDARVPSVYAAHSFRSCISTDGAHLTAWDGAKPLEGRRLWHQYYYLGQDLEATCTAAETIQ